VLFIDLDHFKTVNDTPKKCGISGESGWLPRPLGRLSDKAQLRLIDLHFAMAGDEFGRAVAPDQQGSGGGVARRLLDSLRSGVFCTEQADLNVRASMGLATFPHDAQTPHDIIRQADEMMYVVKNATRDNIGVASRGLMEKE